MTLHCMIDLETLDTVPSAVVLSIGAVLFDPNSSYIGETFYAKLEVETQVNAGRTKSPQTLEWWAKQSDQARLEAFGMEGKQPTDEVLSSLRQYINRAISEHELAGVWGNGSDFDNVIVADLYRSFGASNAWPFWMNRCFRTLKDLRKPMTFIKPQRRGTHHNALDDAVYQAEYLQATAKATGIIL